MDNQKPTPWNKIKKEYLEGATPKELEKKYNKSAKVIRQKACDDKWTVQKQIISNKVEQSVQERIVGLTTKALKTLEEILNTSEVEANKISAARAIIDVSGLKSSNLNLDTPTQVVITRQPVKKVEKGTK